MEKNKKKLASLGNKRFEVGRETRSGRGRETKAQGRLQLLILTAKAQAQGKRQAGKFGDVLGALRHETEIHEVESSLPALVPRHQGMRAAGNQRILAGWWRSFTCSNHTTEYSSSLIVQEKLCRIIRKIILLPAECAQVFY